MRPQKPWEHDWTPEQDATIKAMKAEGKTWAEIGAAVGHSKSTVQGRYKQLQNADAGDAAAVKKDEGGEKKDDKAKKDGGDDKKDKHADKPAKGDKKAPTKAESTHGSTVRFGMNEWLTLQEDDTFSFGELQCLSEIVMRDEGQRWLRIASAFADKTGRRVHYETVRTKFAEMTGKK